MEIVLLLFIVFLMVVMIFMAFWSYPATVMALALKVYRHARAIERMQREQTARINEEWVRTLEKDYEPN